MPMRLVVLALVALQAAALLPHQAGSTAAAPDAAPLAQGCTAPFAQFSPSVVVVPGSTTLTASGFQPGSTVTITGGNRPTGGVFQPESTTATANNQCTVTHTLSVGAGSPPGQWTAHVSGTRSGSTSTLSLSATLTVVSPATPTHTPPPTPTFTPMPLHSPTVTCPSPSAALASTRITQGQSVTLFARGFRPGALVQVQIEGPSGFRDSDQIGPVGGGCEAVAALVVDTLFPPGRYLLTLIGPGPTGTLVAPTVSFEVLARGVTAPPALPTVTSEVPAPTAPPTATATPPPAAPQPPPTAPRPAPVRLEQQLTLVGGAQVPTVGETSEYEHVVRLRYEEVMGQLQAASLDAGDWAVRRLAQGETLTLSLGTELSPDTRVVSTVASQGQAQVRGATLVWEGQLAAGQSVEIRTNLAHTPSTPLSLNQPIRGQSLTVSDPRGATLVAPAPTPPPLPPAQRLVQPAPPPVDPLTGDRMFATGFAVADDNIWTYFVRRGGERTFGAPLSRLMLLNGAWVQIFEKGMLQVFEDGRVVSVNLLEAPYLPFERFGDLVLPPVADGLILSAPDPAEPDFGARAQEFVRVHAVERFEGLATRFYTTFMSTVLFRDAFFDGRGDPNLIPGFNLEIWGLPTSNPVFRVYAADEVDGGVVLQRFQRGVMWHDARAGTTSAVALGLYLRGILAADEALADVADQSPLWAQYNPEALGWVDRPDELPETSLVLAFTRDDGEGEAVSIGPRAPRPLLVVVNATVVYSDASEPIWIARPGETYRLRRQEGAWALISTDADPTQLGWVPLDDRVELQTP